MLPLVVLAGAVLFLAGNLNIIPLDAAMVTLIILIVAAMVGPFIFRRH